jgi:hypothetical protein
MAPSLMHNKDMIEYIQDPTAILV